MFNCSLYRTIDLISYFCTFNHVYMYIGWKKIPLVSYYKFSERGLKASKFSITSPSVLENSSE